MTTKGEKTKEDIVKAAVHLFAKRGLLETTFSMIAEKAGISQPALYLYFKGKPALLAACSIYGAQVGRRYIDSGIAADAYANQRLEQYIRGNLKFSVCFRDESYCLLAMLFMSAEIPELKLAFDQINQIGIKRIGSLLLQGQRESLWSLSDPERVARMIHSYLTGEMVKTHHWPDRKTLDATLNEIMIGVKALLDHGSEGVASTSKADSRSSRTKR